MNAATPRPARSHRATVDRMAYLGRRGAPKPPTHIWNEMMAAGAANDHLRLGLAHAAYESWLADQGIGPVHHTGFHQPDKVWND